MRKLTVCLCFASFCLSFSGALCQHDEPLVDEHQIISELGSGLALQPTTRSSARGIGVALASSQTHLPTVNTTRMRERSRTRSPQTANISRRSRSRTPGGAARSRSRSRSRTPGPRTSFRKSTFDQEVLGYVRRATLHVESVR
jgi:hypothetical protein